LTFYLIEALVRKAFLVRTALQGSQH